jgi:predicted transcriptional regulator
MYVDILQVMAQRGPMKLSHIMYKANVNCVILKETLDYLIGQGLVEEKAAGKNRVLFSVTLRGVTVVKYFRELKQALPMVESDQTAPRVRQF